MSHPLEELLQGAVMSKFATKAECAAYRAAITDCIAALSVQVSEKRCAFAWVPVSERKPHLLRPVITSDGESVRPAYRTGDDGWSAWPATAKVTHWADYPEAPK